MAARRATPCAPFCRPMRKSSCWITALVTIPVFNERSKWAQGPNNYSRNRVRNRGRLCNASYHQAGYVTILRCFARFKFLHEIFYVSQKYRCATMKEFFFFKNRRNIDTLFLSGGFVKCDISNERKEKNNLLMLTALGHIYIRSRKKYKSYYNLL